MRKNSTLAEPIPAVACESHYSGQKRPYTAEEALSESEINAVIQLIQLSTADSYSDHHQEDDNSSNNIFSFFSSSRANSYKSSSFDAASSSYSSSSPAPSAAVVTEAEKGELAQEDHHGGCGGGNDRSNFRERRNKRYRSIVELYRVTDKTVFRV